MLVHNGQAYAWESLEPWDVNCKAVKCSVCGSCTPEALEKALDDGIDAQWDGFMEDNHDTLSLFADEMELEKLEDNERQDENYYRHVRVFHLTHLWGLNLDDRERLLNKICERADAEPDNIFQQFSVL